MISYAKALPSFLLFPLWAPFALYCLPRLISLRTQPGIQPKVRFAAVLLAGVLLTLTLPVWLLLALYCAPSIVAIQRGGQYRAIVLVCNLLLGWTLVAWGILLLWAVLSRGEVELHRDYEPPFYQSAIQPVGRGSLQ